MQKMRLKACVIAVLSISLAGISAGPVTAQAIYEPDQITISKAEVVEILRSERRTIPGTDTEADTQRIRARVLDGAEQGKEVEFDNDYLMLKEGETFYLRHLSNELEGTSAYSVADPSRLPLLYTLIGIFVVCVAVFGGKQGIRGLLALGLSFVFILYLLMPGIIRGYSPVLVSMGVSFLIVILGSYITHGLNRVTTSAVIGMLATIVATGALAFAAIHLGRLTGLSSDEAVYLNFDTRGAIDLTGLLMGAIMIGLLGVLYDAAIGQAVSVDELKQAAPGISRQEVMRRALRIGREHVGALVNTLAIAYVGASLPLLLLFYNTGASVALTLNSELFATEIIRMMVGSVGLVLAVPITTIIATEILVGRRGVE